MHGHVNVKLVFSIRKVLGSLLVPTVCYFNQTFREFPQSFQTKAGKVISNMSIFFFLHCHQQLKTSFYVQAV